MLRRSLFIVAVLLCSRGARAESGTEPFPVRNQHPLNLVHYSLRPEGPETTPRGAVATSASFTWSNTFNSRDKSYLIDAETRVLDSEFRYGVGERTEMSVLVPVVWRGGGSLDSFLKEWDASIGVPNRKREDAPDDRYYILGETREGGTFTWADSGTRLGNVVVSIKQRLADDAASAFSLSLPTSSGTFGAEGVDAAWSLYGADSWEPFDFTYGSSVVYQSDDSLGGIDFAPVRAWVFAAAGYALTDTIGLNVAAVGSTQAVKNVPRFPDQDLYLDFLARYHPEDSWSVGALLRENPLHPRKSTDASFLFFVSCALP